MFSWLTPTLMIWLKSILYLLVFLAPLSIIHAWKMMQLDAINQNLWAWAPLIIIFGIVPVVDHLIGTDPANPSDEQVKKMDRNYWYRLLTLLVVPAQFATLFFGAWVFVNQNFSLIGQIGWVLSVGIVCAILAINVGHELIHKRNRLESWAGGLLYASVCYGGFKVEHVRGHHVNVSTPEDASSARYGQSLYRFLPAAYKHNFINAWKLEGQRLKRLGLPLFHWRNELIWWYGISAILAVVWGLIFGWQGVLFYLGVSWMSFTTLEIINYVEHYGLHRRKLPSGRYERTTPAHSWNSNYLLSNMALFHLQRHSDHHAFPLRRYQVLRHYDESPQLPTGYAGMYVIALIPPLWFWVMNPRVEAYYKGEEWQLSADQFEVAAKQHAAADDNTSAASYSGWVLCSGAVRTHSAPRLPISHYGINIKKYIPLGFIDHQYHSRHINEHAGDTTGTEG